MTASHTPPNVVGMIQGLTVTPTDDPALVTAKRRMQAAVLAQYEMAVSLADAGYSVGVFERVVRGEGR